MNPNFRNSSEFKEPYTRIPTNTARDKRLSDSMLGILTYILTLEGDEMSSAEDLAQRFGFSVSTARRRINRLIELGYASKQRTENGHMIVDICNQPMAPKEKDRQ